MDICLCYSLGGRPSPTPHGLGGAGTQPRNPRCPGSKQGPRPCRPVAGGEDSEVGEQAQPLLPLCWDLASHPLLPTQRHRRAPWTPALPDPRSEPGTVPQDRWYPELRESTSTTSTVSQSAWLRKQRKLQWESSGQPASTVHLPKHIPWLCRF